MDKLVEDRNQDTLMPETPKDRRKGFWIPIEIYSLWESREIDTGEMMLLTKIWYLSDTKHGCFASNQWLAEWFRCSTTKMTRLIRRFIKRQLLVAQYKKIGQRGTARYLRLAWDARSLSKTVSITKQNGVISLSKTVSIATKKIKERNKNRLLLKKKDLQSRQNGIAPFSARETFLKKASAKLQAFMSQQQKVSKQETQPRFYLHLDRLLRYDLSGTDQTKMKTLKQVIKAYITKPHTKFTPMVSSAKEFRKKFFQLKEWALRVDEEESREDNYTVLPAEVIAERTFH